MSSFYVFLLEKSKKRKILNYREGIYLSSLSISPAAPEKISIFLAMPKIKPTCIIEIYNLVYKIKKEGGDKIE